MSGVSRCLLWWETKCVFHLLPLLLHALHVLSLLNLLLMQYVTY